MFRNPCFWPQNPQKEGFLTPKQGFLTQKQEIISELISELFSQNFREFEKPGYFRKISKLRKPNYSETQKNEKFRNFRLTQGLIRMCRTVLVL